MKITFPLFTFLLIISQSFSQIHNPQFTKADTLRGSLNNERTWWDVLRYDITIKPNFDSKTTEGSNLITYKIVEKNYKPVMQIDLQDSLQIDSIILNKTAKLNFLKEGNVYHVETSVQELNSENSVNIFFHGKPTEAIRPPWNGGWSFKKDSLGRPWMTVTCQGLGASVWFPNKDHQSDEPDNGASLTMIVPNNLVGVSNGRLKSKIENNNGTTSYKWEVVNPINNYDIIPYIGNYVNFNETFLGIKGKLALDYWVLDYNLEKAKNYLPAQVKNTLNSFEYWFGPYPFYEDGYKLIETDHLGMEHQSAIAYGNKFLPGYLGSDLSGTGFGLPWDFIVVHESGHEWFGNNITSKDIADMYIHESFTNYSETLYVETFYGKEAANLYNYGLRQRIYNDIPIIGMYDVNNEGSGDMYNKGGNMLHTIRHSINNDYIFRNILEGLNQTFYHQTVTSQEIQNYISQKVGFDYGKVFYQYLNTIQIPELQLFSDKKNNQMFYRWANCIPGFNLPLTIGSEDNSLRIYPSENWQRINIKKSQSDLFNSATLNKMYYISVKEVSSME